MRSKTAPAPKTCLGDIIIEGEDILGDGVNIAARIEALAEPGGVALSHRAYEDVVDRLEQSFADGGECALKNIARPVRIWHWPSGLEPAPVSPTEPSALALPDKPSLAVLPFANQSNDPDQEFFADGITEDVTTALSRFQSLFVISRNSTFTYKDQAVNVSNVGRELGVRYIIEGSVRKAGNRVRVTSQLIEAESGNHIWAERFDRDLDNIFDLQDELSEAIVGAVEQEIGSIERTRAAHNHPDNPGAWELFQRGMFHVYQMTGPNLVAGIDWLHQSLEKDPKFADAHAYLAFAYLHQVFLGAAEDVEARLSNATRHTQEAIRLDDRSSFGHEILARLMIFEKRYDEAIVTAKHAVQLNPGASSAYLTLGAMSVFADRCADALEPLEHAMRLSPRDHRRYVHLHTKGVVLCEIGRQEEGLQLLREAVRLPHGDFRSALYLARYSSEAGFEDEARRATKRVLELNPNFSQSHFLSNVGAYFHPDYVERFLPHIRSIGFPE
jgi:adenylate cyclase